MQWSALVADGNSRTRLCSRLTVKRRFTRLLDDLRPREYEDRLEVLKLWSLVERRHRSDLIELFKMAWGLFAIPLTDFFKFSTRPFGSTTRGHSWKLIKAHSDTDTRLYFFLPESWIDRTVYRRRQLVRAPSTFSRGTWKERDRWRWVFSWTTGPLNPNAALCIHVYNVQLWLPYPVHEQCGPHLIRSYIGVADLVRYLVRYKFRISVAYSPCDWVLQPMMGWSMLATDSAPKNGRRWAPVLNAVRCDTA